ncbi:MAG: prolyl oligopeptidase family serine peptidase [Planctomycetes bacterium]|nr:prolyl oligopeptidase family serine peptidase [Planctomycetota bacterium]
MRWSLTFLILCCCGCPVLETPPAEPRPPQALAPEVLHRFDYALAQPVDLKGMDVDEDAVVYEGRVVVQLQGDEAPTPITFEFWRCVHAARPAPAILLTPILGGGRSLARSQCRALVEAGFHVVLVNRGTRILRATWAIEDLELWARRSVAARLAVFEWMRNRPEIDPGRIGAMGISLGGIITTLLMAVEPRLHSAAIALAGGDIHEVIRISSEERLIKFREAKAAEHGISEAEVCERIKASFVSDPRGFAPAIDPRRLLTVLARLDTVMPHDFQVQLWEDFGRPLRYDLFTGHYSGGAYLPYIMAASARWFTRRFARPVRELDPARDRVQVLPTPARPKQPEQGEEPAQPEQPEQVEEGEEPASAEEPEPAKEGSGG